MKLKKDSILLIACAIIGGVLAFYSYRRSLAILVVPIFIFFGWLEKRSPKGAKTGAIIFASVVWLLVIALFILLYLNGNL